ncbi:MAG: hypothetical protein ACRCY6_02630 [Bacteroidales bacterium]
MTWLWVILAVAAIGGIIGYLNTGKGEGAAAGAAAAGIGCAYVILYIFLGLLGLFTMFKLGTWLFS